MDQLMVDITDIPDVMPGDIATLIGRDGTEYISAESVANEADTLTNELRIKKVYSAFKFSIISSQLFSNIR